MDIVSYAMASRIKPPILDIPRTSDATLNAGKITATPFTMTTKQTIDRIQIYVATTQAAVTMALGIYNEDFVLVVSSEVREIPPAGLHDITIPDTTLRAGKYYAALHLHSSATTALFGVNAYTFGYTFNVAFPLTTPLTGRVITNTVFAMTIKPKETLKVKGLFALTDMTIGAWAINGADSSLWGIGSGKFQRSTNVGASWTAMMVTPGAGGDDVQDVIISGGKIYCVTNQGLLYQSLDLTAASTWTDITPLNKSTNARGRPYSLCDFNSAIWWGEYSVAPNEITGGPKIHRFDPVGGTWIVSRQFPNARHFHSFYNAGALYCSLGDASYGVDIGIWRVTTANVGIVDGIYADTWTKWTSAAAPYTDHYPVDFIVSAATTGVPDGIYATSDRPRRHILYAKTAGSAGFFNLSTQIFQPANGDSGETVRGLAKDTATNNIYYYTAETSDPAIWMSPPPYTQAYKLHSFASLPAFIGRTLFQSGYMLNHTRKFTLDKFMGQ